MSDYAGPILGAVGAVVGGYFGGAAGAQWGWSIGSAIGGAYAQSQQVLPGPKIGDVQKQTSQEGGFRPIVYGRSHPISGNIIADGGPVIVTRRERQGKGGPKVESESAYRTYAVGVCEGEATLLQAWRNGILVYDAEDGSMAAENAAFLEYATWYTGSFDQPASPDLEEVYGAGQAPYFRGTAYLSIHNEDVTDQRGAWSQWQFRVFRGAARSYTTPPYPIQRQDHASLNVRLSAATLRTTLHKADTEAARASLTVEFTGGHLREPVVDAATEPSAVSLSVEFTGGSLRSPIVDANASSSSSLSVELVEGVLRTALVTADVQETHCTLNIEFIGGTLYEP